MHFSSRFSPTIRYAAVTIVASLVTAVVVVAFLPPKVHSALHATGASFPLPILHEAYAAPASSPDATPSRSSATRAAPAASPSSPLARSLAPSIDRLLNRWQAGQAFWGISVVDMESGETLYVRNGEKAFLPASNQKIITTAMALDALGPTYRYQTALRFQGRTDESVMRGDFVIDGSGDPTFGSTKIRGEDPLRAWANRLANMGVERVEGRLIGDDNRFDDRPYPEGWDVDYITKQAGRYIGASASGLSYKDNVVSVKISASRPGAHPIVRARPSGTIEMENQSITSRRWRGSTLQIDRSFESNKLALTGSVARSYRGTVGVPISNPTVFALNAFVTYLRDAGIETDLKVYDIDDLSRRPRQGKALFVHVSPPMSKIVSLVNKESSNFYAEQLFRTYGWGGSTRGAARRTDAFLRRSRMDTRSIEVYDGSGLSRKNLMTPVAMVDLLRHMDEHSAREAFRASLPNGGENNTTLEYRLSREPVTAKTGSLRYVRALSGYAVRPNGSRVAFAIFANNYTGPSYQIIRTIDDIVRVLTRE